MDKGTLKWRCGKFVHMPQQTTVTKPLPLKENQSISGPKCYQISTFLCIQEDHFPFFSFKLKLSGEMCVYILGIWPFNRSWKGQREVVLHCLFVWLFLISSLIFQFLTVNVQVLGAEK